MIKRLCAVATLVLAVSVLPASAGPPSDLFRTNAASATLAEAENQLAVQAATGDQEAIYALGATQFLRAFEKLNQGFYRHGFDISQWTNMATQAISPGGANSPSPAIMPPNSSPEPMTYEILRSLLSTFVDDLDRSSATLERVTSNSVKLNIDLSAIRFDINGDGKPDTADSLHMQPVEIHFDRADALWLRGYANVFAAQTDFLLAHNFEPTFTATGHLIFPHAGLPLSRVAAAAPPPPPPTDPAHPNPEATTSALPNYYPLFADFVAYVHTMNWEVVEPQRRARVRQRLLTMVHLSREMIAAVRAERDNDHEWLPNARQDSWIEEKLAHKRHQRYAGRVVTRDTACGGCAGGPQAHPVLAFQQGFDLKAFFDQPTRFDAVMLATGMGAIPYLRDGPKVTTDELTEIGHDLGANPWLIVSGSTDNLWRDGAQASIPPHCSLVGSNSQRGEQGDAMDQIQSGPFLRGFSVLAR